VEAKESVLVSTYHQPSITSSSGAMVAVGSLWPVIEEARGASIRRLKFQFNSFG
jgi:hypothetical protein